MVFGPTVGVGRKGGWVVCGGGGEHSPTGKREGEGRCGMGSVRGVARKWDIMGWGLVDGVTGKWDII